MKIRLYKGDITELNADAIVNAANRDLSGGDGVDGAIHAAAGPRLLEACRKLNGCRTGEAKITKGYNLKAKYVIHAVGPMYYGEKDEPSLLALCYRNSLNIAKAYDLHSIVFPCISAGAYGYPLKEASDIAINTVVAWLRANLDYEISVTFCCFSDSSYDIYTDLLSRYKRKSDSNT